MKHRIPFGVATTAAAALVLLASVAARADTEPKTEVENVGATAVLYRGLQVNVAISFQSPRRNPGLDWLMLDAVMTSAKEPIEIPRTAISMRTPGGQVVPLASYQAYASDYSRLAPAILQDDAIREPLDYLVSRRFRRLDYFPPHGVGIAWDSVWLDEWHNHHGRLFFQLPGPVRNGTYELLIDLPEGKVVIPFTV